MVLYSATKIKQTASEYETHRMEYGGLQRQSKIVVRYADFTIEQHSYNRNVR